MAARYCCMFGESPSVDGRFIAVGCDDVEGWADFFRFFFSGGCGDTVSALVARFNREGLAAVTPRHGGGAKKVYDQAAKERILREYARMPDREQDGTAHWTLSTLKKALRSAPDGLARVSTFTLWQVLREAGQSAQRDRSWCETGTVVRKRKDGAVVVTDPDTHAKRGL